MLFSQKLQLLVINKNELFDLILICQINQSVVVIESKQGSLCVVG